MTADFETTTNPNFLRIWAFAICDIDNPDNIIIGTKMDDFFEKLYENKCKTVYFHNLKFDGEFILSWFFANNYVCNTQSEKLQKSHFDTLISDNGLFYKIRVNYRGMIISFLDSLKIITMSVEQVAKTFKLPLSKLKIDYNEYRAEWHELTSLEKSYIENDVKIMAIALKQIFDMGYTKMTQGSNALNDYKEIMGGKKVFENTFPIPSYDEDIRQSYKGGWCYLNPFYKNKIVNDILTLDVNSLYPSRMYCENLPYGEPIFYHGKYEYDELYNIYVQKIKCEFELKPNKFPTIQLKHSRGFNPTEYLINSNGDCIVLCLTDVDLKLFLDNYNVYNLEYLEGWKFKSSKKLFTKYIDKWIEIKNKSAKENNAGMRQWAKIMLNSLYGKFATNPRCAKKIPYLDENEIVKYKIGEQEERQPIYIAMGSFITAYARNFTIRSAQKIRDYSIQKYNKDMFIYSDTDSIHTLLSEEECKAILEIDSYKLGAWKIEGKHKKGKFIRAKTYMEGDENNYNVTCAGMPKNLKNLVTWSNFREGAIFEGKLMPKRYAGGVVLEPTTFQIMGG